MSDTLWGLRATTMGLGAALLIGSLAPAQASQPLRILAQAAPTESSDRASICPPSALSRMTRHRIAAGETLDAIAAQYELVAPTLLRLNPSLQSSLPVGTEILVPPFNGIVVSVPSGQSWEQVAERYSSRADVLFEINGCQAVVPGQVFVPGLNWLTTSRPASSSDPLKGYPLPEGSDILSAYGWQPDLTAAELVFNTGVTLAAAPGTSVLAVGEGTVAFAGQDSIYGSLVVVNHQQGLQTRYANLGSLVVAQGESVRQGTPLGTVAADSSDSSESFLFFEVRLNSDLGWVAQDPQDYIPALAVR